MKATPKSNRQIVDEASEWFVEFRVGDVDSQARVRFDEWVRRSPEHIRAYIEIARTYVEMPNPHGTKPLDVEALIAYAQSGENIVPFDHSGNASPHEPRALAEPNREQQARRAVRVRRLTRRSLLAIAASIVVSLASAVWWQSVHYPLYSTDIGERRSVTLADGSTVDLNARSKLRVEFSNNERRVELLDGQALFQVAKDKSRPFIVASGEATVRAVGTQFDVNRKDSGTTVTVLEGRVAVYSTAHAESEATGSAEPLSTAAQPPARPPHVSVQPQAQMHATPHSDSAPSTPAGLIDPSGSAAVFLSAGEQVTVTPAQTLPAPARADIIATTAWMQRRLIFDGSKLSDVVQEFNRYNKRQLVIEDAQLSDFHVSGVYSSTDPTSLIRFLREQPGVKVTENENEVQIAPK